MNRTILFLDVDGVLNRCGESNQGLERDKIDLLKFIIDKTKCHIVLSSTWRKRKEDIERITKEIEIIDCTPVFEKDHKEREIFLWKYMNTHVGPFVIIDDDIYPDSTFQDFLVSTQSFTGLTLELANKAISILKRQM